MKEENGRKQRTKPKDSAVQTVAPPAAASDPLTRPPPPPPSWHVAAGSLCHEGPQSLDGLRYEILAVRLWSSHWPFGSRRRPRVCCTPWMPSPPRGFRANAASHSTGHLRSNNQARSILKTKKFQGFDIFCGKNALPVSRGVPGRAAAGDGRAHAWPGCIWHWAPWPPRAAAAAARS